MSLPPFDMEAFTKSLRSAVEAAFRPVNLPVDRVEKLVRFGSMLAQRSGEINLTRILDPEGMAVRHFLDSSHLLAVLKKTTGPVLDMGTGGGVPGVPLAILRNDLKVIMIDGTDKKVRFVREVIGELGLDNTEVLHARAEEHLKGHTYQTAITRAAVKPQTMFELLETTGPAVKRIVFMEGARGKEHARDVIKPARSAGYEFGMAMPYRLPGLDKERYLLCFDRTD